MEEVSFTVWPSAGRKELSILVCESLLLVMPQSPLPKWGSLDVTSELSVGLAVSAVSTPVPEYFSVLRSWCFCYMILYLRNCCIFEFTKQHQFDFSWIWSLSQQGVTLFGFCCRCLRSFMTTPDSDYPLEIKQQIKLVKFISQETWERFKSWKCSTRRQVVH